MGVSELVSVREGGKGQHNTRENNYERGGQGATHSKKIMREGGNTTHAKTTMREGGGQGTTQHTRKQLCPRGAMG